MNDDNKATIEEVPHPHDRFFRQCIQHQSTHQAFLKKYLPPAVFERINRDQLELIQTTLIDKNLKMKESDCIFLTQFNQQPGYIYVLIEHQLQIRMTLDHSFAYHSITDSHDTRSEIRMAPDQRFAFYPIMIHSHSYK